MTDDNRDALGTLAKNTVRVIVTVALSVIGWAGVRVANTMDEQGQHLARIDAHMEVQDNALADFKDMKARREDYIRWRAMVDDRDELMKQRIELLEGHRSMSR